MESSIVSVSEWRRTKENIDRRKRRMERSVKNKKRIEEARRRGEERRGEERRGEERRGQERRERSVAET